MQCSRCLSTHHSETWTLSSVLSKLYLQYQCKKSFTPCGNRLRPVLEMQNESGLRPGSDCYSHECSLSLLMGGKTNHATSPSW
jgi:hypothetical protein